LGGDELTRRDHRGSAAVRVPPRGEVEIHYLWRDRLREPALRRLISWRAFASDLLTGEQMNA
jgi:hypothetical protein